MVQVFFKKGVAMGANSWISFSVNCKPKGDIHTFKLARLVLVLFGLASLLIACSGRTVVFLPTAESSIDDTPTPAPLEGPVQIRYFFDRTQSMMGFVDVSNSAYIRAMPDIWGAGDDFGSAVADASVFYSYGDLGIHRVGRAAVVNQGTGVRSSVFYRGISAGAQQVRQGIYRRPFYVLDGHIRESIDPGTRSLYVVVTDLYEGHDQYRFYRFFETAFERNMSGAFFAVESEFDGVVWDAIWEGGNRLPFPATGTTGMTRSAFFILIIGSHLEVAQYSENLSSRLGRRGIMFNHTVFLLGPEQRGAFPETAVSRITPNINRFESYAARFYMLNLQQSGTWGLGLRQWSGATLVAADVEAYQIMHGIGSLYSALLTIDTFDTGNFEYDVVLEVWFHPGESWTPSHGVTPEFSEFRAYRNHFAFRIEPTVNNLSRPHLPQQLDL